MLPLALKPRGGHVQVGKARTMTPAELREAVTQLYGDEKVAAKFLAAELNVVTEAARSWLRGQWPIPGPVATAVRLLCELSPPFKPSLTPRELDDAIDELYDYPKVSDRRHHLAVDLGVSPSTALFTLTKQDRNATSRGTGQR